MRIVVLFNLKADADATTYEAWATAHEFPGVNALPSIDDFRIYRATGLLTGEGKPPYAYIQVLDVGDMDGFGKDAAGEAMRTLAAAFGEFADDPLFITTEPLSAAL